MNGLKKIDLDIFNKLSMHADAHLDHLLRTSKFINLSAVVRSAVFRETFDLDLLAFRYHCFYGIIILFTIGLVFLMLSAYPFEL